LALGTLFMRLRSFMLAVSVLGALGAILLAADMYRRLVQADTSSGAALVYSMAHVIGVAALAIVLLALALALIAEAQIAAAKPAVKTGTPSAESDSKIPAAYIPATHSPATLVLFTRYPEAGHVKTRLIRALGSERAANLARAMLKDLVDHITDSLDHSVRCVLCFDPHSRENESADPAECEWRFRELLHNIPGALHRFEFLAQCSGPLGERLAGAMRALQEHSREPLVFIGSAALVDAAKIEAALSRARLGEAYLLPSEDGGYVLLALPENATPAVFENVAWSTHDAARTQAEQIQRCSLKIEIAAETFFDVDEEADLERLKAFLAQNPEIGRRTAQVLG